jgi:hypothetical protein
MKCEICERNDFKNISALVAHISNPNKNCKMTIKEYYDKFLRKSNEGYCKICGKETSFYSIAKGYKYDICGVCKSINPDRNKKIKETKLKNKIIFECTKLENDYHGFKIQCKICNRKFKNYRSLSRHIKIHNIYIENYYLKYINSQKNICSVCNKETSFNCLELGYHNLHRDCVSKDKKIKKEVKLKNKNKFIFLFYEQLDHLNLKLLDEKYLNEKYSHNWACTKCNNIFQSKWNDIQQGYGKCPICFPKSKSSGEIELLNFIKSIESSEIIENSRDIIKPYELDIYIPSKNIAIEFNGLYWHSKEHGKDKKYHLNKTESCLSKNIKLIHIFEDEWIFKQDIAKSRLKQLLNLNNNLPKIHARKCEIKEVSSKIKNKFLEKYHLQGKDNSNIKLGAFYNDALISIMTFSKGNISKGSKNIKNIYELNRFCSNYNYHIPGIASKLLSYFKNNYKWKEIYSYADRRWSTGNLYKKIGFELDHITKPNYFYIKEQKRIHRFNLRKKPDEPKNISEAILRAQEGYTRIYDCGHLKFKMIKI